MRPTQVEDAVFILELFNSPNWIEFIGDRNVHTSADARTYIEDRMIPQLKRLGYSTYTIRRKSDGSKMGTIGLYDREGLDGIDLGFALLPEYENQGYAFEASEKLVVAAAETFGLSALKAITTIDNLGSQKLLRKLGFQESGNIQIAGSDKSFMLYGLDL
ncbi:GNAT family N-acetyltransferase [Robiginitalea myxolifaciens]|uniref:GNAT family N-acetyltransferase n=1 Tax=Robiginitalea myxolifaciens TaxID=400055 RepID=UPI001FE4E3ED|nr:GNAT family N-acetyltransferase [Robiginitalea myxolifaciens]